MIELNKLLKVLEKACAATEEIQGQILDDITVDRLSCWLLPLMHYKDNDSRWAAHSLIVPYKGQTLTRQLLISLVCRMFHFKCEIKAGISPTLWKGNKTEAVMYCNGVSKVAAKRPSLQLYMTCLLGAPAGLSFTATLSRNYLEYALGKFLGLPFRAYNSPAEFIGGCYFQCLVEEDTTGARIADLSATDTMKKLNKKLADARLSLRKCNHPQLDCSLCPKKRKECPLSPWK